MSAYELIRLLAKMPPDARVYVPGYESGVDDLTAVVLCGVDRDGVGRLSCEGEFEMSRDGARDCSTCGREFDRGENPDSACADCRPTNWTAGEEGEHG